MKTYPTIPFVNKLLKGDEALPPGDDWYVFDKYDGSNIRVEWNKKSGFYKFGRRNGLLDHTNPVLLKTHGIFANSHEAKLDKEFRSRKYERVLCFFEFHGPSSFAGGHDESESHRLTLIDINVHKKGFLSPKDFLALCASSGLSSGTDYAALLYHGEITEELIASIRNSTLVGITDEGVVCKCETLSAKYKIVRKTFKYKTSKWLDALKAYCKDDISLYQKLM
jgi:hypothetical protein